ncbi:MAG: DUF4349 domain-containing protein [Sphingobacteriales bacterium]|nr:MAG: DUF4349 domain-containing protein [Sphingobacteriales bacterium]
MKTSNLIMLLAGAVLLQSCSQSSENYRSMNSESSDTALVAADSVSFNQAKLVKTADIGFKVKNVSQTCEKVSALAAQYRGMVTHHQMISESYGSREVNLGNDSLMKVSCFNTRADMTLKLPTEKLEEFMNKVSHMSLYVTMRRMDIEDKSFDYLTSQLRLNSRNELVKQQKSGRITLKDPMDVLVFKDELANEQVQKRRIDDAVKSSVITLDFYESNTVVKEIIANDDPTAYNIPFHSRFGLAIDNGLQVFVSMLILLTNLWAFMLAGLGVWLVIHLYKKKQPVVVVSK